MIINPCRFEPKIIKTLFLLLNNSFHIRVANGDALASKSQDGELDALLGAVSGLEKVSYSSVNLGCFKSADFSSLSSSLDYLQSVDRFSCRPFTADGC